MLVEMLFKDGAVINLVLHIGSKVASHMCSARALASAFVQSVSSHASSCSSGIKQVHPIIAATAA